MRPAKSGRRAGRGAPSKASSTLRGAHTSLPLPLVPFPELPLPVAPGESGESVVARITVARESPVTKVFSITSYLLQRCIKFYWAMQLLVGY